MTTAFSGLPEVSRQTFALTVLRHRIFSVRTLALLPWLMIVGFFVAYILLAFQNYSHFETGQDLGAYTQALFHLSHGRLPYSTFKEQVLWGDHAHFVLVFLAPLYRLLPDARTLLVVQALAVTTSGFALYRVARDLTGRTPVALVFLFSYLSFFGIQYALDFDFHPSVLTAAAIAWALYAAHVRAPFLYGIALILGLMTREDAPPIFFMIGVYLLLRRRFRLALATMVVATAYFLIVAYAIMPRWTPGNIPLTYLDVEDKNPATIIYVAAANPVATIQNMFDNKTKVRTIKRLFRSYGYLPLLSPLTYLGSAPIFYSRFPSPNEYRWGSENHENANIAPLLAFGALYAFTTITRLVKKTRFPRVEPLAVAGLAALLLMSIIRTAWADPGIPLRHILAPKYSSPSAELRARAAAFHLVKQLVTDDDGVSASSGFVAHLGARERIYTFPTVKEDTQWIIVSPYVEPWPLTRGSMQEAITALQKNTAYRTVFEGYGVWAFKKIPVGK